MKRNFDKVLTTFDGEQMKLKEDGKALATAKAVIVDALLAERPNQLGTDKMKCFELAERIHKTGPGEGTELTVEDLTTIKDAVGSLYKPLVVGQVYRIIEEAV